MSSPAVRRTSQLRSTTPVEVRTSLTKVGSARRAASAARGSWLAGRPYRVAEPLPATLETPSPSANPRSAPATSAAPACSQATLRSRGHRASLVGLGRCARRRARRSAAQARYRPAPPLAATSRHTVDGARPSPLAIPPQGLARRQSPGDLFPFSQRQPQRRALRLLPGRPLQRDHRPPDGIPRPVDLPMQPPHRRTLGQQLGDPPSLLVRHPIHSATSAQNPTGSRRGVALIS